MSKEVIEKLAKLGVNYRNKRSIAAYVQKAAATGNPVLLVKALEDIARVRGMTGVAREVTALSGREVSRVTLYRSLSGEFDPYFRTIIDVMNVLGLQFEVKLAKPKKATEPTTSKPVRKRKEKRLES